MTATTTTGPAPWGTGVGPPPGQPGDVIPADLLPPILARTYHGQPREVALLRQVDAEALAQRHYHPISQGWIEGSWPGAVWALAILACLLLVGILLVAYLIAAKPDGELTVFYERRLPG